MLAQPYLIFNGNCEEAFTFYKSVFDTDFISFIRYKEMRDGTLLPESEQNKVLYVSIPLGEEIQLMGNDNTTEQPVQTGSNFAISVSLGSLEEDIVKQLFERLSENGEILFPFQDTYWADRFGMCRDKFGVQWRINYKVTEYI